MKRFLVIMGAVLCAALLAISCYFLIQYFTNARESDLSFDRVRVLLEANTIYPDTTPPLNTQTEGTTIPDVTLPEPVTSSPEVVYAAVYEQNPDFVGWIHIDGTRIDYPVMQSVNSPSYYLKHSFEKSYSDYGVPFVQENCDLEKSDNLILYGHHMKNGSMFSDLCLFEDRDFYETHRYVTFDTLKEFGQYEIVAVFKTVAYSTSGFRYFEFVNAADKEAFESFIDQCKELSLYDIETGAEYGDRLITLSTCEYSRTNGRMVIVAKRI